MTSITEDLERADETTEVVVRLPDRWQGWSTRMGQRDSGFKLIRYRGRLPNREMLGEYDLGALVDGPIRSVVAGVTRELPTGIEIHLARSCLLDQVRALLDAARSGAPGALYQLSVRRTRAGSAHLVEVEGVPDLEGRAFLPRELLESDDGQEPEASRDGTSILASGFSTATAASQVVTSIQTSGAWTIRLRVDSAVHESL